MTTPVIKQLGSNKVNDLLSRMTLDEKLAQLGSFWIFELQSGPDLDQAKIEEKMRNGIGQVTRLAGGSTFDSAQTAKAANRLQRYLLENTRLGIPAIVHEECCSGAVALEGTRFPQMIGLASTFRPELAERMTSVIRRQMRALGAHQGLAPVMDVLRDPRWGRTEETFGEDPTLVAHFGTAYVRGLQGGALGEGVMATGKHFVGHSLSLGGLNCGPVLVGDRELWDTFLVPFQSAIRDANIASMMCAYPEVDNEVVAASYRILTDWLRNKLGFDGLLVSDYFAVDMLHNFHYVAPTMVEAAVMALKAGVDVELPSTFGYGDPLRQALEAGDIDMEFVDHAVSRHLAAKEALGLFDNPYVEEGNLSEVFQDSAALDLAYDIAAQSMVLLKNDGLLPLPKGIGKLAVIGPNADSGRSQLGDYSYASMLEHTVYSNADKPAFAGVDPQKVLAKAAHITTVLDGIRALLGDAAQISYAEGCDVMSNDTSRIPAAVEAAQQADACILVLGDRSGLMPGSSTGEFHDSVDLKLPGVQGELAKAIFATGKPVVVVLVNGRPFAEPWLDEQANAILEAWLPGEQGGAAIAAALFGEVNPGGKLPVTIPRHVGQVPVYYNHKPSGMFSNWYGDYVQESVAPLYVFGHGLSYTQFAYDNLSIEHKPLQAGDSVDIAVDLTNTGKVAGEEVVQLYLRDVYASSPRPVQELRGYARLALEPGETRKLTFHLPVNQLAFIDNDLDLVLETGKFEVMVGSSSADIRLRGEIEVAADVVLPLAERVFVCPVDIS